MPQRCNQTRYAGSLLTQSLFNVGSFGKTETYGCLKNLKVNNLNVIFQAKKSISEIRMAKMQQTERTTASAKQTSQSQHHQKPPQKNVISINVDAIYQKRDGTNCTGIVVKGQWRRMLTGQTKRSSARSTSEAEAKTMLEAHVGMGNTVFKLD